MFSQTLPATDSLEFLQKIDSTRPFTFSTWKQGKTGWSKLVAYAPVAQYTYYEGEELQFEQFVENHKGKFLAGFINYDLGYQLHKITPTIQKDLDLPLISFAAYDNYVEFAKDGTIVHYTDPAYLEQVQAILEKDCPAMVDPTASNFTVKIGRDKYERCFNKILNYIKAGDMYQINYTHRMEAQTDGKGCQLFLKFLKKNPVNYAAFWQDQAFSISSISPECFVDIKGKQVTTYPIKGTRPRGKTVAEDREMKKELLQSEKEQSELFMITDLLRNDVGKISEIGSVKVVHKKRIQTLAKVFHTYSKVTGTLAAGVSISQALLSMFPGGSITGCPKKRAMEITDELEGFRRGVYTGSMGYILPNQDATFNIAIRTVVQKGENLYLGVGGGITIKSEMKDEFDETLDKARTFLRG